MQAEAAEMVEESFGKIILHTVGRIYTLQSAIYLGNFFEAQAAKMRQSVRGGQADACCCIGITDTGASGQEPPQRSQPCPQGNAPPAANGVVAKGI